MNILAIETTGKTAGVALVCPSHIIAEFSVNNNKTHSSVLMPLIDAMLKSADFDKRDIDYIACSAGPGSFTGLRIGAAAAKGLAFGLSRRIIPVATLDAMAYNISYCFQPETRGRCACASAQKVSDWRASPAAQTSAVCDLRTADVCAETVYNNTDGEIVVPIMDARRGQVYTALYGWMEDSRPVLKPHSAIFPANFPSGCVKPSSHIFSEYASSGFPCPVENIARKSDESRFQNRSNLCRLTSYMACNFDETAHLVAEMGKTAVFLGDGVAVFRDKIAAMPHARVAPLPHMLQRAASVGGLALKIAAEAAVDASDFAPYYIRPSQAEREAEGDNNAN